MAEEEQDSDTDSDSEVEEYSGMEQPPLIKQLKTILAEYPDDGQIIKELVQNAEDAGASEMKILYDGRRLNTGVTKKVPYRKFFKAPALCFYNNEVFNDDDWRGIKMIYNSVKKEDPLKVGRFGLGFKSVFHITDNPCVISGDRILLINPHEKYRDRVCITMKLKRIRECKRLKVDEIVNALSDTFGFSEETLNTGQYTGTIFWFPLRETQSELSDTCYDFSKVLDLYKSYESDAVHSLLFLKSLCKVELCCRGSSTEYDLQGVDAFFSVELEDTDNSIKMDRKRFLDEVTATCGSIPNNDIISVTHPTFKTSYKTTQSLEIENTERSWVVINVYKGEKMSNTLRKLVNDKDLSYMPYIGAAVPLTEDEEPLKGHIFCFLPLPQEKKSLSGLPVHFNGFFALSQNRRHLKWASDDQDKLNMHRDKSIEWNECLVNELLPGIYIRLIKEMIAISISNNNPRQAVEAVYRCTPDESVVDGKWERCVEELYEQLLLTKFVFVSKHSKWVEPNQPLYTMFNNHNIPSDQRDAVIKLLDEHNNVESTMVPKHIWDLLERKAHPRDISPDELCKIIRSEDIYRHSLSQSEKLSLLGYISKDHTFELLQGLELLPLENDTFMRFSTAGGIFPVYFCTVEEICLFPGLESKFVSSNISHFLRGVFSELACAAKYQLRILKVDDMVSLVKETVQQNFGSPEPVSLTVSEDRRFDCWIQNLWVYIFSHFPQAVALFSHLPLIPCLTTGSWDDGTWKNGEVFLYNMDHIFLVKSVKDVERVPDKICEALERMSVKILPSLPGWLDTEKLPCIFTPNGPSIVRMFVRMFEQQSKYPQRVNIFNTSRRTDEAEAVIEMLAKITSLLSRNAIMFLQQLKIFKQKGFPSAVTEALSSIEDCNLILSHTVQLPVRCPKPILVSSSSESILVAKILGAYELSEEQMVGEVLEIMNNTNTYSSSEVQTFMLWFLENIHRFQSRSEVLSLAQSIAFVDNGEEYKKPSDLYDPMDCLTVSLFAGERKFPVSDFVSEPYLHALRQLGLKTRDGLTADCLYTTAKYLDEMCRVGKTRGDIEPKAKMFIRILEERNDLLFKTVGVTGSQLHASISTLKCIPHKKQRPHSLPEDLAWKGSEFNLCAPFELKSMDFSEVAGSIIPLVRFNSEKLAECFNWNLQPDARLITKQLENIVMAYNSTNKIGILPLITKVYRTMMELTPDITRCLEFQNLLKDKCIWWGDGFCTPCQILLERREEDIDIMPYMHTLPSELEPLKAFFLAINCHQTQDLSVLLKVLEMIAEKHRKLQIKDKNKARKDLQLVLQILNKLFRDKINPEVCGNKLLVPVHTNDDKILVLEPYTHCTYCDASWLKELIKEDGGDEDILYVHADVSAKIAEGLGVKSLRKKIISDAEGLEEWGQEEPLTRRLHNILKDEYVDGIAVPKEIIQNADDACATTVQFIYDERENLDVRTQLLDEKMASFQGPAFWAYNNALFSETDLKNITQLRGATKESDTTKIGQFGFGFCSVYNLTDVPSFVSGQNMVIFDPHRKYLNKALPGRSPGLKINLRKFNNKMLLKRMQNQFQPFHGVLGCNLSKGEPYFNGTLFRFPLRTPAQAAVSEIKKASYSKEEMLSLLHQFVEAIGNMLIFTQHLKEIKIFHIPATGVAPCDARLLCRISKHIASQNINENQSVLSICSDLKVSKSLHVQPLAVLQKINIIIQQCEDLQLLEASSPVTSSASWLVSWATGSSESLELSYTTNIKRALPLGSVACLVEPDSSCLTPISLINAPVGFYTTGHVFCYLPLPVETQLDVHVNGSFAVMSNRRGLQASTEDDKYSYGSKWNETLLHDAVALALANLLESIHKPESLQFDSLSTIYKFYQLWPEHVSQTISSFRQGFYRNIICLNRTVFEGHSRWIGIQHCLFLNKTMSDDPDLRDIALTVLHKFCESTEHVVIDIPSTYFDQLQNSTEWDNSSSVVEVRDFVTKYFLPHIDDSYWLQDEATFRNRNKLLLFCLNQSDPIIMKFLMSANCIPTSPKANLKKPSDLVHPEGRVAVLFTEEDERFPDVSLRDLCSLNRLVAIGMVNDVLQSHLVIDRATSIPNLALKEGGEAACERCRQLLAYLSSNEVEQEVIESLKDISFLPVLHKPDKWCFPWQAEKAMEPKVSQIFFKKAESLFLESCKDLVACSQMILYFGVLATKNEPACLQILRDLGVRGEEDIKTTIVTEQLLRMCDTKVNSELVDRIYMESVFDKVYQYLDDKASRESDQIQNVKQALEGKPVILLGMALLPVSKVAMSIAFPCEPELYEVGKNNIVRYRRFLAAIGVRERFEVLDVFKILEAKRKKFCETVLPADELALIRNLLELLTDLILKCGKTYDEFASYEIENIVAPDTDCILRPTSELCFDDPDFSEISKSMIFVHDNISKKVAENLGVYTKRRKYIDDYSFGIPFEQKEELVTRLKNLLQGYPDDIGVMKELIQNADDANATEIHFIKDFRKHSCDRIFDESFEEFQGPALLVFNDSSFSQKDLEGIRKLGVGNKAADPATTGQFGVGFNAVYNLTDLPAFLTKGPEIEGGETVCLFDPLQKHLKKDVGRRFNTTKVRNAFPDVLSGFCEESLFSKRSTGTVFRLPLRQKEFGLSSIKTEHQINMMLDSFKSQLQHMLLFARSVQKISVSHISSGSLKLENSVCADLSDRDLEKRKEFAECCKHRATELKASVSSMFTSPPVQVSYELHLMNNQKRTETYFVVQRIGFSKAVSAQEDLVKNAVEERMLGMLPIGGAAVSISQEENSSDNTFSLRYVMTGLKKISSAMHGRLYCFLPLPGSTGLPISINGHFALDQARRGLWKEDEGYRSAWNCLILSDVVASSYIEVLNHVGSKSLQESVLYDERSLYENIEKFNGHFPLEKKAADEYCHCLTNHIFRMIVGESIKLFPLVHTHQVITENKICKFKYTIVWSEFQPTDHHFPVCFTKKAALKDPVFSLMTRLGLKLTVCTPEIFQAMKDLDNVGPFLEFKPRIVIDFLRTYKSSYTDRVAIGRGLPAKIEETKLEDKHHIKCLMTFCNQEQTFLKELNGLPLLLSNDGFLRLFEAEQAVYCSEYCSLFKKSGNKFLHSHLVNAISGLVSDKANDVIKCLTLGDLPNLLKAELDSRIYINRYSVSFDPFSGHPNKHWIKLLWKLIIEQFLKANESCSTFKQSDFLQPLQDLCLIPTVIRTNDHALVKIVNADYVLALDSFAWDQSLYRALKKLGAPILDKDCVPAVRQDCVPAVRHNLFSLYLSSADKPHALLRCLSYHRDKLITNTFKEYESCAILDFFSKRLEKMKANSQTPEPEIKRILKTLPLYLTLENKHIAIDDEKFEVFVVPRSIPLDGIYRWAIETNKLPLKERYSLEKIYNYIGLSCIKTIDAYLHHILKTWEALPVDATLKHLAYIKNILLQTPPGRSYTEKQLRIIDMMKTLDIIPHQGSRKRASAYYNPDNIVFMTFCRPDQFPPGEFAGIEWKEFLTHVGLKTEVTNDMFVEFAEQVAADGQYRITECTVSKSNILVQHLFSQVPAGNLEVYKKIKHIKFVVPFIPEKKLTDLSPQPADSQYLISFSNSISYRQKELCWTRVPLLCETADPQLYIHEQGKLKNLSSVLGIYVQPKLNDFIIHCQNVCDSLKLLLQDKEKKAELQTEEKKAQFCKWLSLLLCNFYSFLDEIGSCPEIRLRLYYTPLVFDPRRLTMVCAHNTVINLLPDQEIAPHLIQMPRGFSKFTEILKVLGAAENPSYSLYVKVLEKMKSDVNDSILGEDCISEWLIITAAIDNLFRCLKNGYASSTSDRSLNLYLPSRNKQLLSSQEIVIPDNVPREKRLQEIKNINFFLGFSSLKLNHTLRDMELLPKHLRPKFLSDITTEQVVISSMTEVEESRDAVKLETFLQSAEFIQGIFRMVNHAERRSEERKEKERENNMAYQFQTVHVREVTGLETIIELKGKRVNSSLELQYFHRQKHEGVWWIYLQRKRNCVKKVFHAIRKTLLDFVNDVTENILIKYNVLVYEVINMIDNPREIAEFLNDSEIDVYDLPPNLCQDIFPVLGSYIQEHMYHLLDYNITEVSEHEYKCVALEIEDDAFFDDSETAGSDIPLYIYVRIVKKIPSEQNESPYLQRFQVYTGEEYRIVSCLKIFKFMAGTRSSESRELVSTDTIQTTLSNNSMTKELYCAEFRLREAWKLPRADRWQVIKRLLLRWHPDRNKGNQELCAEVFCHLKQVLDTLRNDLYSDGKSDGYPRQKRVYPDFTSHEYNAFMKKVDARGRVQGIQAQGFGGNSSRGPFSPFLRKSDSKSVPVKDPGEAKRWQNQAKHDLRKALESMAIDGSATALNWNCYMCHQASEKSLKAAWFATNANGFNKKTHDIRSLSRQLASEISEAVEELSNLLGEDTKMRYPDTIDRDSIPSTIYTVDQALSACDLARKILDLVQVHYLQ